MNKKENIELILKLALPMFILLGLAKVTAYYQHFHLPILEYLSLSEMIVVFLSSLYVYVALFINFAIMFLLDKQHFRGSLTIIFLASLLLITFSGLSNNFRFNISSEILSVWTGILIISIILISISYTSVMNYISSLEQSTRNYVVAAFTLLVLIVISTFQGIFEAKQVKKNHIYTGTTLGQKGETIISNDTNYFIGKTNDYIFFYNQEKDYVKVYPINTLTEFIFKTKARE